MVTALMVKEWNFIWMLAYKENFELLASKPDDSTVSTTPKIPFKFLRYLRFLRDLKYNFQ